MDYKPTEAGEDLRGVIMSLGFLGAALDRIDAVLEKSRSGAVDVGHAAQPAADAAATRRTTINFIYPEMKPDRKSWWLVIDGEKVDLCLTDPAMTSIFMSAVRCAP